jgi:hypothetical protein
MGCTSVAKVEVANTVFNQSRFSTLGLMFRNGTDSTRPTVGFERRAVLLEAHDGNCRSRFEGDARTLQSHRTGGQQEDLGRLGIATRFDY